MRPLLLALALIGCNASPSPVPGDGVDAACVTPVLGEECTVDQAPCFPGGCAGYDWSCSGATHLWERDPTLHEPCNEAGVDAGAD